MVVLRIQGRVSRNSVVLLESICLKTNSNCVFQTLHHKELPPSRNQREDAMIYNGSIKYVSKKRRGFAWFAFL